jgi:hypothetical protein
MPDQCLKVHPVPRTKGQLRLKSGHEPLERLADHRIGPLVVDVVGVHPDDCSADGRFVPIGRYFAFAFSPSSFLRQPEERLRVKFDGLHAALEHAAD